MAEDSTRFAASDPAVDPLVVPLLAAIVSIAGSLGPWASAGFLTEYGIEQDGVISLVAGIVAALLLAPGALWGSRLPAAQLLVIFAALSVAAGVGVHNLLSVDGLVEGEAGVDVTASWGLILVAVGGLAGALCMVACAWMQRRREAAR